MTDFFCSPLQLSNCQGWVEYLIQLAGGDVPIAHGILKTYRALLRLTFNEARRDDLKRVEGLLAAELGIDGQEMLVMVRRCPTLLHAAPATVEASMQFLQTQLNIGAALLRAKVAQMPQALYLSPSIMQEKLLWLVNVMGMPSGDAVVTAMCLMKSSIIDTLEPHRQWLLKRGFSAEEVTRIVRTCPQVLCLSLSALDRRLTVVGRTCRGTHAATDVDTDAQDVARRLCVSQPTLFTRDFESHSMTLKLRFWQDELGYSLSDLQYCALFMMASMTRIVTRSHMLKHLFGESNIAHGRLTTAFISGSGAKRDGFGPRMLSAYVKRQQLLGPRSATNSVADVLVPLADKLTLPQSQQAWRDLLQSPPSQSPADGKCTPEHCELYAGLWDVYLVYCQQLPAVREWLTAAAAAKDADEKTRVGKAAADAARRAAVKASKPPPLTRKRKGSPPAAAAAEVADDFSPDAQQQQQR